MQPSSGDWVPRHWQTIHFTCCVIGSAVTCSNKTSLKRKEFSKPVGSAAHWPRQEGELDLFPLIRLPPLLTKSILLLLRFFFRRGSRPVKRADHVDSSSYRLQSTSVSTALFQVFVVWRCTGLALPLRLHSAVKSLSISLAPHCSEHLTQKPAQSQPSHRAPLVIRSLHGQAGMCEAGARYWFQGWCACTARPIMTFKHEPGTFFFLLSVLWVYCEATLPRLEVTVSLHTGLTRRHSNNALISNPVSSQSARKQASSNVHFRWESSRHHFPNFFS